LNTLLYRLQMRWSRLWQHLRQTPQASRQSAAAQMRVPRNKTAQRHIGEIPQQNTTTIWAALLVWLGKLAAHLFDALALPELTETVWRLFKYRSRPLSALEQAEAQRVFAHSLPYQSIRIDEYSIIARLAARLSRADQMGVATFYTINFTRRLQCQAGNYDMAWLIHELVHVAQMQYAGSRYMGEAIHAQQYGGYSYGTPLNLVNKNMCDFNREQQAEIAKDYYFFVLHNRNYPNYGNIPQGLYEPYIAQLQQGIL
jgi:hypothetical protein